MNNRAKSRDIFELQKDKRLRENNPLQPFKIVSLWDMLPFCAELFINLYSALERLDQSEDIKEVAKCMADFPEIDKRFDGFNNTLKKLGLAVSIESIKDLQRAIGREGINEKDLKLLFSVFRKTISNELATKKMFILSAVEADYYDNTENGFCNEAMKNFPSAVYDMREAGSCFAFNRNTACVFHLMRTMEVGLNALGQPFGVSVVQNWHATLMDIKKEVEFWNLNPSRGWKGVYPFYAEAISHFRVVKDAWRNHTMHIRERYSVGRTQDIFNSVTAFMRHLATKLHE
jgi:hypothetical protein